jgi:hypothetical protein
MECTATYRDHSGKGTFLPIVPTIRIRILKEFWKMDNFFRGACFLIYREEVISGLYTGLRVTKLLSSGRSVGFKTGKGYYGV